MKKLTVIIFENDIENKMHSDRVCERFADLPSEKEFCGIWGEILFNYDEVLFAICTTINHFIDNTDKKEIIFGCCKKDHDAILDKIHIEHCAVDTLSCQEV